MKIGRNGNKWQFRGAKRAKRKSDENNTIMMCFINAASDSRYKGSEARISQRNGKQVLCATTMTSPCPHPDSASYFACELSAYVISV